MDRRSALRLLGSTSLSALAVTQAPAAFAAAGPLYKDARAPIPARVADLLKRMTLPEKIAQMRGTWAGKAGMLSGLAFDPAKAKVNFPDGIGALGRPIGQARPARHRPGGRRRPREMAHPGADRGVHQRAPALGAERHAARHPGAGPRGIAPRLHGHRCDLVPAGDRDGGHLRSRPCAPRPHPDRRRNARPRGVLHPQPGGRHRARPALGPDRGDLRRGSIPGGRNGRGDGRGAARSRQVRQARPRPYLRHAQAHDRARPAAERHQRRPRRQRSPRSAREFLQAFQRDRAPDLDRCGHAELQRDRRHPEPFQ